MKIGDKVKMSRSDISAYADMEGVVDWMCEDNSFSLNCGGSILIVPMNDSFKRRKNGVWIWLNGEHIFHKSNFKAEDRRHQKIVTERIKNKIIKFFSILIK